MSEEDLEKHQFDQVAEQEIDPKEIIRRSKKLNAKVLETAIRDLLLHDENKFLDSIYFLFAGNERTIQEFKQKMTFEAFCARAGLDPKTTLSMVWSRLTVEKKRQIKQALKDSYNIELDKSFKIPKEPK